MLKPILQMLFMRFLEKKMTDTFDRKNQIPNSPAELATDTLRKFINPPPFSFTFSKISNAIALGLGSGNSPFFAGTVGTLFAWLIFRITNLGAVAPLYFIFGLIISSLISIWAIQKTQIRLKKSDSSHIVIDEILAFITLLYIAPLIFLQDTSPSQITLFILFRLFDMAKPFPIRRIEQHFKQYSMNDLKNPFGVWLDDFLAALYVIIILYIFK